MIQKYKIVFIFDLGGVVINRGMWDWRDKINKMFDLEDKDTLQIFIKKHYQAFFQGNLSWEEYLQKSFKDLEVQLGDEKIEELRQLLISCYKPQYDVLKNLDLIRKRGGYLVLLSDQNHEVLDELDNRYKILEKFDHVIISSDMRLTKRDQELFEITEKRISKYVCYEKIVFIDDLEQNLTIPHQRGWDTILFKSCKQLRIDLKEYMKVV